MKTPAQYVQDVLPPKYAGSQTLLFRRDAEAAVAAAQADMQARLTQLESLLLDCGECPGRYETDGALVLPDDDYVVDVEGCYLRRVEAESLLDE